MNLSLSLLLSLVAFGAAVGQPTKTSSVQILSGGEIRLAGDSLGSVADLNPLKTRLAAIFQKGFRQVSVESDKSSDFSDVLRVLRVVRDLGAKPLSLKVAGSDGDFMVMIPVSANADEDVSNLRPNPLTLVVRVAADRRLYLNGDIQKSQHELLARLRQVFRQRKKMKAYRPGSNEIEATLFLKPYPNLSFAAAIDLLGSLHRVGANPLGLQIDDLGDGYAPSSDATEQSLAANGAIAYFSSNFFSFGLDADRAPQLKAIVRCYCGVPMRVLNHADLSPNEIAEIQAQLPDQQNLKDVMNWALSYPAGTFMPQVVADVIVQDEFTHDVVVPWREGIVLVYDTT